MSPAAACQIFLRTPTRAGKFSSLPPSSSLKLTPTSLNLQLNFSPTTTFQTLATRSPSNGQIENLFLLPKVCIGTRLTQWYTETYKVYTSMIDTKCSCTVLKNNLYMFFFFVFFGQQIILLLYKSSPLQ